MPPASPRPATPATTAVIEIATSKIICLVVQPDPDGEPCMAGFGHQRSRGIKSGLVTDLDEASNALRIAIAQAERMAGAVPDRIVLAVACGRLRSSRFVARAPLAGPVVRRDDLARILAGGAAWLERGGRTLVELAHSDWRLDCEGGIRDPLGMAGHELAIELAAVTADEMPLRNLAAVAERCHLTVDGFVATPVASALAVTSPEERRIGTLVVDIGAGVTTLAHFVDGRPTLVEALPVGGNLVTYDLARGLVTTVAEAERIKTLYATLVKAASNDSQLVSYPLAGEEEVVLHQTSRAHIGELVRPRIGQLLDLVAERLACGGIAAGAAGSVVLTGGSSQLVGLDGAWTARFGGVARIGRPRPLGRMPANMCGPAFATVIGLARAAGRPGGRPAAGQRLDAAAGGYLGRVQQWFRESF